MIDCCFHVLKCGIFDASPLPIGQHIVDRLMSCVITITVSLVLTTCLIFLLG